MLRLRHFFRLLRIFRILKRHGLDDVVRALRPQNPVSRFLGRKRKPLRPQMGQRIRLALEDLGPIFVKFGQALSTRPDLLPPDIAQELAKLQDKVPPFSNELARETVEAAFGQSVDEVFQSFETEPLASASIAQVHAARLHNDTEVVVKILRPGIDPIIEKDLDVLGALAELAHRYWPDIRRLKPRDVVQDYSRTIRDELDFMREAANGTQLKRNWETSHILELPEIYWDYCHPNVMVMERVYGVQISDVEALNEAGVNMKTLAERGVEIFFTQVFKHNFFHADMHPGNIFVNVNDPEDPRYISIDFGIVGTLDISDQRYLAANLLAFFHRDYRKVSQLHVDSGWVPAGTRVDEFESAIRTVCEPIFDKPLKDISFGQFLVRLFSTARRFNMEVQPQLVLLQKTLLNIEGLGRQLYPDLDLWVTAKPFLEEWMAEKSSGKELMNKFKEALPELATSVNDGPQMLVRLLQQVSEGTLNVKMAPPNIESMQAEQLASDRRRTSAIAGAGFVVGAAILAGTGYSYTWVSIVALLGGMALLWRSRS
ncbi:MAG: ubiquinone biosynthesis regulatory protein kinase UbiB [Gammaproteobacteria bacterium]